jgi:predicted kinase
VQRERQPPTRHADERHDAVADAIADAFVRVRPASGTVAIDGLNAEDLERRVLETWQSRQEARYGKPFLTLVGGYAGSGKTEFGRFLSTVTGWALLDKDSLTRPITESLLVALGGDPNDRQTQLYRERVRPLEYNCLIGAAFDNLDCGVPTVLAAPFLSEISDAAWLQRLLNRCAAQDVEAAVVWVDCDIGSMHEYLAGRGAARDTWKLSSWEEYTASLDLSLRPPCDHFTVDNRLNAAVSLGEQARRVASRIRS